MTTGIRQIRFACRTLSKQPVNALLSFLALAVGIGLCAAMFNILSGMVLRGLPFPDADRLYYVGRADLLNEPFGNGLNYADYQFLREHLSSFEELAGAMGDNFGYADKDGLPERIEGAVVSHEFFSALGLRAIRGRVTEPEDDRPGAPRVALISHRLWMSRYGGAEDVVGKIVHIEGQPTTIIGILPAGVAFPWNARVWMPLHLYPGLVGFDSGWISGLGRLKSGQPLGSARIEATRLFEDLAATSIDPDAELPPEVEPLAAAMGHDGWNQIAWVMMVSVLFVLAIVCLNVANLRLGRALQRTEEFALRRALGASGRDLMTLVVVEAAILAAAGALGGAGVAYLGKSWFQNIVAHYPELVWWRFLWDFSVDARTLLFTTAVVVSSCLLSSTIPAWFVLRGAGQGRHATMSRSSSRTGDLLVMGQLAFTFVLLTGAGLMIKSFVALEDDPLPYDPEQIMTARVRPHTKDYDERRRLWQALLERTEALPGVESTSFTNRREHYTSPGMRYTLSATPSDDTQSLPAARWEAISPGYFETLGAPILEGRAFTAADTASSLPVAIVNEGFARKNWPGENAVGKTFLPTISDASGPRQAPITVIGVAPNLRMEGINRGESRIDGCGVYIPAAQSSEASLSLLMRIRSAPDPLVPLLRQTVYDLDPTLVVYDVKTVRQFIHENTTDRRLVRNLFSLFGGVSIFLATLGIFGVVSASITRRRREIGIRMAMGARRGDILRGVFHQSFLHWLVGLTVGLGGAIAGGRFLGSLLYRVSSYDLGVWITVGTLLGAAALVAATFPAYRASRVDPVEVLRE